MVVTVVVFECDGCEWTAFSQILLRIYHMCVLHTHTHIEYSLPLFVSLLALFVLSLLLSKVSIQRPFHMNNMLVILCTNDARVKIIKDIMTEAPTAEYVLYRQNHFIYCILIQVLWAHRRRRRRKKNTKCQKHMHTGPRVSEWMCMGVCASVCE